MVVGVSTAEHGASGVIVLYFDNARPIGAEQLSLVLSTLAKDYRRFSKDGELVVQGVEFGSLKLKLAAAVSAGLLGISHLNTIADFGERVVQGIERLRHSPQPSPGRRPGDKSALEILKLAAQSESAFELNYSAPDGERLYIKMAPAEAERVVRSVTMGREKQQALAPPAKQLAVSHEDWMDDMVKGIVESRASGRLSDESRTLLMVAAETLKRHGSSPAVEDFAQRLASQGLSEEANLVRGTLPPSSPRRLIGPN